MLDNTTVPHHIDLIRLFNSAEPVGNNKCDIDQIVKELQEDGHFVEELDYSLGGLPEDYMVDIYPHEQKVHIRIQVGQYVVTSIGLIMQRGMQ